MSQICRARLPNGRPCNRPITKTGKCIAGRNGTAWHKQTKIVYAEETHCWICRKPVNQTLHHNNDWARTVDHKNGDRHDDRRVNLALAHRRCNTLKSDTKPQQQRNSRKW